MSSASYCFPRGIDFDIMLGYFVRNKKCQEHFQERLKLRKFEIQRVL